MARADRITSTSYCLSITFISPSPFQCMSDKLFEKALTAFESGDLFEAEKNLRMARGVLSDQPEDLAKVYFMLAMILEKDNRVEEALDSFKTCFDLRASSLGESHSATALTLKIWASVASRIPGDAAIELNQRCVKQAETILGPDNFETVSARMKLAACLIEHGNFNDAFDTLLQCARCPLEDEDRENIFESLASLLPKVSRSDASDILTSLRSSL